jgi:hypothetical protein
MSCARARCRPTRSASCCATFAERPLALVLASSALPRLAFEVD